MIANKIDCSHITGSPICTEQGCVAECTTNNDCTD